MALVGTLSFNFQVLLPLLARFSFDGGPQTYALLVTAMGIGSVAGALVADVVLRRRGGTLAARPAMPASPTFAAPARVRISASASPSSRRPGTWPSSSSS